MCPNPNKKTGFYTDIWTGIDEQSIKILVFISIE